jgi:hypothetical protein
MYLDMQEVQLYNITNHDIQEILQNAVPSIINRPQLIFLGAAYLYTFHLDDFEQVRKFNLLGRYDIRAVKQWHNCLERWLQDQTVTLGDRTFKPIAISREFRRVVNEGMEILAQSITGGTGTTFEFRSIGDGTATAATPGDTILGNEIDRINVNETPEGGSITRDGTTIYSVGNHEKSIITPVDNEFTECGMESTDDPTTDEMLDHSIFVDPIPHIQNEDAPGSTTVIYMCSS